MSNLVFPPAAAGTPRLAWENVRTDEFRTLAEDSDSGLDTTAIKWAFPRYRWRLAFNALGQAGHPFGDQIRLFVGFHMQHRARGDTFLFKDPEDFQITDQAIGTGNGVTKNFQIVRNYGGFVEPIYEVQSGTLTVKKNGVTQTPTTHYTQADGLVQFVTAPANGDAITASCQFYFRVRFDDDSLDAENFTYLLHALREVRLRSTKR